MRFNIGEANIISMPYGSGDYYRVGGNFIKVQDFESSSISEVLVSALLGYVVNLLKSGNMDYSLCTLVNEVNRERVGVYTRYIGSSNIILIDVLSVVSGRIKGYDFSEYDDGEEYMNDRHEKLDDVGELINNTFHVLRKLLGVNNSLLIDYFAKLALVDTIVYNGDRSFDNIFIIYNKKEQRYMFAPYGDFGNSLVIGEEGSLAGRSARRAGPFSSSYSTQLSALCRDKMLVIKYNDFVKYVSDCEVSCYGLDDYYKRSLDFLLSQLNKYKAKLWVEAK